MISVRLVPKSAKLPMTDPSMRKHITLNRNLDLRDTTLIGIGAMIGAGIYFFSRRK
jgi:amino acid permease